MQALRFGEQCSLITTKATRAKAIATTVLENLNQEIKYTEVDEMRLSTQAPIHILRLSNIAFKFL